MQKSGNGSLDWSDVPLFLAVARAGSLAGAARTLGLDQTTVSRRLSAMERRLSVLLFARQHGHADLTALGRALLPHAEAMEGAAHQLALETARTRAEPQGEVLISAPPTLARTILAPAVRTLTTEHPSLTLVLTVQPANVRLEDWQADLALRLSLPADAGNRIMTSRLGSMDYAVYRAADGSTADRWIAYGKEFAHVPEGRWIEARLAGREPALRSNDPAVMAAAAAAGAGRTILPVALGDTWPGLMREGPVTHEREVWLLWRRELTDNPAIAAVIRWLRESCRPLLETLAERATKD